jgi:uncharacterized protein YdaU (DUF1376 family)
MQLYVADYLADTAHLKAIEHGAYLLLIMNYWQTGKPLNNSNERLTNVARMSKEEWSASKETLQEFFKVDGDTWTHLRIEADLFEVNSKATKASDAGKKSAEARRLAKVNERSTDVKQTFNHTDTDTDTYTDTDTDKKKKHSAEYTAEFELAWAAYPARPGANKKEAFKAWIARVKAGADQNAMIEGAARYASYCKTLGIEPQFIKQPTTFFGPGDHYSSDWTAAATQRKPPSPDNFAAKDYGTGVNPL